MIEISKDLLEHLGGTPTGVLSLFVDSFVRLRKAGDNHYSVDNGIPTIELAPYGYNNDVALLHELGHFNAATDVQLLKPNYGFREYRDMMRKMDGHADVLHEIRVIALEWNLMEWYGYNPSTEREKYADWLYSSMPGMQNFAKSLGLKSEKAIIGELRRRFMAAIQMQEADPKHFFYVWEKKNGFLKDAMSREKQLQSG